MYIITIHTRMHVQSHTGQGCGAVPAQSGGSAAHHLQTDEGGVS